MADSDARTSALARSAVGVQSGSEPNRREADSEADLGSIIQAYHDVTERLKHSHERLIRHVGRLRQQLHEKNMELQRKERLAALGRMAAGVAHEIRNPLAGIGLFASLLERDLTQQPQQLALIRKLQTGIRSLESVVGEVLAFAGEGRVRPEHVALEPLVDEMLMHVAPQRESSRARIAVDPEVQEAFVYCDAHQLVRALTNLVLNALEAAGVGGHVWIRRPPYGGKKSFVAIAVEDDGPGIESALRQRVFDPFFTTRDTGTGLGLAIVHRIVEANGGSVVAGTRTGGGASFVLRVPAGDASLVMKEKIAGVGAGAT